MSQKHNQRTRAEILAKRAQPISKWAGWTRGAPAVITTQQPVSRSKYMPHIGKKEQERAKRCYMTSGASYRLADDRYLEAPWTLYQMSKRQYEATLSTVTDAQWNEYDSVF